jgi:hypothetical protein
MRLAVRLLIAIALSRRTVVARRTGYDEVFASIGSLGYGISGGSKRFA